MKPNIFEPIANRHSQIANFLRLEVWDGLGRLGTAFGTAKRAKTPMFMRVGTVGRAPWTRGTPTPRFHIRPRSGGTNVFAPQTLATPAPEPE